MFVLYLKFPYLSKSFVLETVIRLEYLVKNYYVGTQTIRALRGIDLSINRNEYVAIMGASGSGKSTMMNILGCLDVATEGTYILNNQNVSSLNENELAEIRNKEIGFVFQTFNLLAKYSALENVALPLVYAGKSKSDRESMAAEVLESVGLGDRITHKPNELSGGQRQRVAIARAMINKPSIILADEPTGNLDSETSVEIMRLFEKIHRLGNTIILVTHEPDIALYAQRIIKLKDGKIENDSVNTQRHEI